MFSLSPTKPLVAGEGGLVATNDDDVAEPIRIGRDYGNPGDYDTRFVGLNARMSELHAAVALESLARARRAPRAAAPKLADRYVDRARRRPGRRAPARAPRRPLDVQGLHGRRRRRQRSASAATARRRALRAEGVDTRCYFYPPVHRQTAYAHLDAVDLPVTDRVAAGSSACRCGGTWTRRSIVTVWSSTAHR